MDIDKLFNSELFKVLNDLEINIFNKEGEYKDTGKLLEEIGDKFSSLSEELKDKIMSKGR